MRQQGRQVVIIGDQRLELIEVAPTESALTTFAVGDTHGLIEEALDRTRHWLAAAEAPR